MENQITTGVKITVDTTDLDTKFTKSAEALNATLTKSQKALHLTYNEQGLLVNAMGQCVEGLSTSQIKLGQYVDILGQVHTVQGGYIDGLNKSQIAMGQYTDAAGNIYDKTGQLIGVTEKAAKALEKEQEAVKKAASELERAADVDVGEAFGDVSGNANKAAQSIEKVAASIFGSNSELTGLIQKAMAGVEAVGDLDDAFKAIKSSKASLVVLTGGLGDVGKCAKFAASAIKGIMGALGPVGATIGILATSVEAVLFFMSKASHSIKKLPEELQEAGARAYAAGKKIESLKDALSFGVMQDVSPLRDAIDEIARINEDGLSKLQKADYEHYRSWKNGFGDVIAWYSKETSQLENMIGATSFFGDKSGKDELQEHYATIGAEIAKMKLEAFWTVASWAVEQGGGGSSSDGTDGDSWIVASWGLTPIVEHA